MTEGVVSQPHTVLYIRFNTSYENLQTKACKWMVGGVNF
jgi:hypothetical protein